MVGQKKSIAVVHILVRGCDFDIHTCLWSHYNNLNSDAD